MIHLIPISLQIPQTCPLLISMNNTCYSFFKFGYRFITVISFGKSPTHLTQEQIYFINSSLHILTWFGWADKCLCTFMNWKGPDIEQNRKYERYVLHNTILEFTNNVTSPLVELSSKLTGAANNIMIKCVPRPIRTYHFSYETWESTVTISKKLLTKPGTTSERAMLSSSEPIQKVKNKFDLKAMVQHSTNTTPSQYHTCSKN